MATHPQESTPAFPGQVCPDCSAAYVEGRRVCPNPACPSNPDLSDEVRRKILDRAAAYRADQAARRKAARLWGRSLSRG